ncbi:hypothetical protein AMATHDRAFT_3408 [Amanita thiersii Skay4041]|uniref:Uncharacterized protein n=1 Tax=Amanita thiersii Skay4041 TaxID=703135 RepID=A0A2A9NJ47_9AGAR|nr:hypothetical protein AMATHDRAFT_3408 [Amanita thiersii Skay4041]
MGIVDSFSTKSTSITFAWPAELTGFERVALSARGDLQRTLSAFFAEPISVSTVYSYTYTQCSTDAPPTPLELPNSLAISFASHDNPITQQRQVLLQCQGKTVCTATSAVRITNAEFAHLFLEEKYAIGQMFRRVNSPPAFHLLAVGIGSQTLSSAEGEKVSPPDISASGQLWRRYRLSIPDFECDIEEIFPSRDMFVDGNKWLASESATKVDTKAHKVQV